MRLRALLDTEGLGLRLLGGEHELDRPVRGVMTTDLRNPGRYLTGGELVLTGLVWRRDSADSEPFVRILANAGVAGLAVGEADLSGIPDDLVAACAHHRLPLFAVNTAVSFAAITEHVVRQVSGERAGDLAAVVDRHRRLMTAGPAGGGPDAVLDLLGSDLDLRAWVLSPTGRRIAGSEAPLAADRAARIAAAHLAVARTGRRGPYRVVLGATTYALFPVRDPAGASGAPSSSGAAGHGALEPREAALTEWLLCVEADAGDWPAARLDLLQGVTQLIAVERDRRDAARAVRRRLAQEILELVQASAPPAEIAARLRVAAPVLLPGGGAAPSWQIVVASLEWSGPRAAAGSAATVQSVLEEALATPAAPAGRGTDRIAVAHVADEAIALVPVERNGADDPGREHAGTASGAGREGRGADRGETAGATGGAGAAGGSDAREAAGQPARGPGLYADEIVAAVREPLSAGLGEDGRLALGVSAVVDSAEGLRGALEEARHARRVAAARQGRVCAAGHHELASHVLLLPFVPDDVRRAFTARLLDPLRDYDQRHRAELIPTLDAFLDCDGSWTRCASRLHLHVNTLRYRIGRIEQLTGRDLSRLEDKLDFYLALRMS
ncbi:PucR family transcriptional regulator ligand-binding domain-containing protein [Streptomyces sp. NRRL F-5126]|uniref:PucR family transcriptional regulator ligand-binding domain-containing protein n=1 Tax=Streptomyces sp. NRRL F-5126 TaxID=1463857 RepID=UPI0004C6D6BB|nr:PucR family transcriptional regulator ligand-binding domain-containing protein [Streptomyces sp. NRRL F-5126]